MNQKRVGGVMLKLVLMFILGIYANPLFAQEVALFPDQTEISVELDEFDIDSVRRDTSYVRHRFLNLNLNLVHSLPAMDESEISAMAQAEPVVWNLELFPDIDFQVQVESSRPTQFGGSFIQGKIVNGGEGTMTLMLGEEGAIRGEVHSSRGVFTISNGGVQSRRVLIQEVSIPRYWEQENDAIEVEISPDMILSTQEEVLESSSSKPVFSSEFATENPSTQVAASENNNQLDVLVIYTQAARETYSGTTTAMQTTAIKRDIESEIEKTNQALSNSGAGMRIRLVGFEEISTDEYTEASCMQTDLQQLIFKQGETYEGFEMDSDGKLDDIHKLRQQYSADFVHLFVSDMTACTTPGGDTAHLCGAAYTLILGNSEGENAVSARDRASSFYNMLKEFNHQWSRLNVNSGDSLLNFWKQYSSFSVSAIANSCRTKYTFTHELGHNLGLFHDRYIVFNEVAEDDERFPLYPYSFGYVDQEGSTCEHTIMSTEAECDDDGRTPVLRHIFSNPNKQFQTSKNPAGESGENVTSDQDGPVDVVRTIQNSDSNLVSLNLSSSSCVNSLNVDSHRIPYTKNIDSNASNINFSVRPEYCDEKIIVSTSDPSRNLFASNAFHSATSTSMFRSTTTSPEFFISEDNTLSVGITQNITPCPRTGTIDLQGLGFKEGNADISITQDSSHPVRGMIYQLHTDDEVSSCTRRITASEIRTINKIPFRGKGIDEISQEDFLGLTGVRYVDLSYNNISSLTERVFAGDSGGTDGLTNVKNLNLSHNDISTVNNAFEGLTKLEKLTLSYNSIVNLPSLSNLSALTMLDISHNDIVNLPLLPSSLTWLNVSFNNIANLSNRIQSLQKLRFLYLSHNQLTTLPNWLISALSDLQVLAIDNNQIPSLNAGVFSGAGQMISLRLNNNGLTTLPAGLLSGVSQLSSLNLSGNRLTTLPDRLFSDVRRLRSLDLSRNRLTILPDRLFSGVSRLRSLDLSGNRLTTLPARFSSDFIRLRFLDLSGNGLTTLPDRLLSGARQMRFLWLNNNRLTTLPARLLSGASRLRYLNLSGNNLTSPLNKTVCNRLKKVKHLILDNRNNLKTLCPPRTTSSTNSIQNSSVFSVIAYFMDMFLESDSSEENFQESLSYGEMHENEQESVVLKMYEHHNDVDLISEITGVDQFTVNNIIHYDRVSHYEGDMQ